MNPRHLLAPKWHPGELQEPVTDQGLSSGTGVPQALGSGSPAIHTDTQGWPHLLRHCIALCNLPEVQILSGFAILRKPKSPPPKPGWNPSFLTSAWSGRPLGWPPPTKWVTREGLGGPHLGSPKQHTSTLPHTSPPHPGHSPGPGASREGEKTKGDCLILVFSYRSCAFCFLF